MSHEYAILPHVGLQSATTTVRPERPRFISLDAPATAVMTDFAQVWAVTIGAHVIIDDALERMKVAGVRMLLVTDESERIIGLITAKDIQGERPVQIVREGDLKRDEITVSDVMVPQAAIEVFTMASVENARVGHVITTLHALERQHGLVAEMDESGRQRVRGVFSTSEIGKRLGQPVTETMTTAHSLAELREVLSGGD